MSLSIGDPVPTFTLPAAEGGESGLGEHTPAVVVFTCNHCPYALAWHERHPRRGPRGGRAAVPDQPQRRREVPARLVRGDEGARGGRRRLARALSARRGPDRRRAFGAQTTPDVFVVAGDGTLAYRGAPDRDHDDPGEHAAWLRGAIEAVVAGRPADPAETEPVGCSVKWRA